MILDLSVKGCALTHEEIYTLKLYWMTLWHDSRLGEVQCKEIYKNEIVHHGLMEQYKKKLEDQLDQDDIV